MEEQFYLVWPLVMVGVAAGRDAAACPAWRGGCSSPPWSITVAMALLYYQGRIGECDVTPEAYWTIGDRCISKTDALYLATITRAGGLLLGAAFAMVWRPVRGDPRADARQGPPDRSARHRRARRRSAP